MGTKILRFDVLMFRFINYNTVRWYNEGSVCKGIMRGPGGNSPEGM